MKERSVKIISQVSLVLASVFWGSGYFISKEVINVMHPVTLVAYRMLAGGIILGLTLLILKKNIFSNFKNGLVLGSLLVGVMLTQTVGLKLTTASNSGFISGMFILFVPFLSYILYKRKSSPLKIVAVGVAVIGLWLLTGGVGGMNTGDVLTIFTALCSGFRITYIGEVTKKEKIDPLIVCFHQFWITGVAAILITLIMGYSLSIGGVANMYKLGYLILFPTVISFALQLSGQRHLSSVNASLLIAFEPVFGAIFAWTLGGEKFIIMSAFGGLLIFAGMILSEVNFKSKKEPAVQ